MPVTPITMRKITDLLRLHFDARLSQRQISAATKLSVGVINKYLAAAEAANLSWPLPEGLTEAQLRQRLFPDPTLSPKEPKILPDYASIHQELKRKGVTRQLLWEEYCEEHPNNHYAYTQFCGHYQEWKQHLKVTLRQTHRAGEKMFVDYCGPTIPIIDSLSGEVHQAQVFVAVLGASNYTYAEASLSQTLPDWINSHVRAFTFFQGVPELVIPDNLRSGVTKACRYEPLLNRVYGDMLEHYQTVALPARPYKPRDKAKAEAGVLLVERWIMARLRKQTFYSLSDLNKSISPLLVYLNEKSFQKLPGSRRTQFEQLDHPALKPLPAIPYQFAIWKKCRVHIDSHVQVDGHYYSVPHQLVTREIEVRLTDVSVECFHGSERVAVHQRSDRKGSHTTVAEHLPERHRSHLEWSPGRFLDWALKIGPYTRDVVRHTLERFPHPEMGYRSCLGLLSLEKSYGKERLEAACERAIALGSPTRSSAIS
ncbi:MAG: IS21 family transposase, partial [Blastocatellia bacterium]|nr:IS21 family transposase [Blastocatellia bacterium]